jgi:hypothetical protein
MADFVEKGYWVVLPYSKVAHLPQLRVSPLGSVPQVNRRPRLIVDLTYSGVNDATVNLVPREAMQFGHALRRVLYKVRRANPKFGPVYLHKIDIADGFYRVWLQAEAALKLAVVLPSAEGQEPLLAIPLALPMGWVESPPAFCAVTETAADLANQKMHHRHAPHHRLEGLANTTPPDTDQEATPEPTATALPPSLLPPPTAAPMPRRGHRRPFATPVKGTDVYVDDFIGMAQGTEQQRAVVRRHIMHAIDQVLSPRAPSGPIARQEAMSEKKMRQGDAAWETRKTILGWIVDTVAETLELPPHRLLRAQALFNDLKNRRRVAESRWHKVLGELRSMVLAIPGGSGLFSILQTGFRHSEKNRIRLDQPMRDQLEDFDGLLQSLAARPTRIAELVPDEPWCLGASDASGDGMGGVWLSDGEVGPILWRERFPTTVTNDLVSSKNRGGTITNSDLELSGVLAHTDVLVQAHDVRERTVAILSDNMSAVSWSRKGSVTTRAPAAYLLRLASLHQRHHRYLAVHDHIKGTANAMADDCSRMWEKSDTALLAHFEQVYPQSQAWRIARLRPEMRSAVISALRRKRAEPHSFLNEPTHTPPPGNCGAATAKTWGTTHSSATSPTPFPIFKSSPNGTGQDSCPKAATLSDLGQWKTPFVPSARRWPCWGPRTVA